MVDMEEEDTGEEISALPSATKVMQDPPIETGALTPLTAPHHPHQPKNLTGGEDDEQNLYWFDQQAMPLLLECLCICSMHPVYSFYRWQTVEVHSGWDTDLSQKRFHLLEIVKSL